MIPGGVPGSYIVLGPGGVPEAVLVPGRSARENLGHQSHTVNAEVEFNNSNNSVPASMGDNRHEGKNKKRRSSSSKASPVAQCSGETPLCELESEKARLNDLAVRLKDNSYYVSGPSDTLVVLHTLVDDAFLVLRAIFEAINKEKMKLANADKKKLVKSQKEKEAVTIQELKKKNEIKIRVIEGEKVRQLEQQATLVKELTSQQDVTLQALEKEREKSLCQICFVKPRDAVVLTCMHHLYCSDCLYEHRATSNRCPTCRGIISGVCKLNH